MDKGSWIDQLDDRQRKEVEFAIIYARDFSHGTDGHNAKLIIAKLAGLLDHAYAGEGLEYVDLKKANPTG